MPDKNSEALKQLVEQMDQAQYANQNGITITAKSLSKVLKTVSPDAKVTVTSKTGPGYRYPQYTLEITIALDRESFTD